MRALSLAFFLAVSASAAAPTEVASAIKLLDAWIETQVAYRQQPGLSIAIVSDQETIWAKGYGYADVAKRAPATPSTIYRMASHTKVFTAIAVMQLRDAGKLRLDDPVSKYLPWFKPQPASSDDPPVTIRHLLTHTSGLPREAAAPYWTDFRFPTREEVMRGVSAQRAVYPPVTRFKYSNLAFSVAGELVTAVSGEPYAAYVQRHILEPLGMKSSSIEIPDEQRARLAVAYGRRMPEGPREVLPFTDCKGITPAASLFSTSEDMARFAKLQFVSYGGGGGRVLSGNTLREMHRVQWIQPDWKSGWGIGFQIWREGDHTFIGHGGSLAGYLSRTAVCPEAKFAVIVLTNSSDGAPDRYVSQAIKLVLPALKQVAAKPEKPAAPDPSWAKFEGRYRALWGDTEVLVLNGELVAINPAGDDPGEGQAKLIPLGGGRFRMESQNVFANNGEIVTFETGPGGEVVRMKTGENYARRLKPGER
jgi:CubicO group peptidase (beta-lactamase class C family)